MHYHAMIPFIAAVANLLLCIPVLRQRNRSPMHHAFVLLTITLASWNLDIFALYFFADPVRAEWWSRLFRTGMCFAPAAAFQTALALSRSWTPVWDALLGVAYVAGALLALINLRGGLVRGLTPHVWGWYIQPTRLYSALTALLLLFLAMSIERASVAYRHPSSPRQRAQAKFWFLGAVAQTILNLTNLLAIYGVRVYPLGSLGNAVFVGIVAYAIVRHRLMDVDYVVRKFVSFSLASIAVLVPGGVGLLALGRHLGAGEPLLIVFAALTLAVTAMAVVPAVQEALESRLQRLLFPRRYDHRMRLRQLAASLVHVFDEAALIRQLGDTLTTALDVERCEFFVQHERSTMLTRAYPEPGESLPQAVALYVEGQRGVLLTSELEATGVPAARYFHERGWEVGMPLHVEERLTGFIGLGAYRDLSIFSGEDLQLLVTVVSAAGVALENARLSRRLHRSATELERARRLSSIGLLAAGLAHEIRNPLVAVKTFLDLLPERLDDREFLTSFRDLSLTELRRVTDLVTDLLALGKSTTADRKAVDVAATLDPVLRLMESTAGKHHVRLAVQCQAGLPSVWADPDQLKQIVLNLLLNAIEVSPEGTRVSVELRHAAQGGIALEVRDEGPGVPADQLDNIFDPFFTTKESGTGLGLALVHQMVVEHGGKIAVDSAPGRGATFRVTLPAAPATLERTGT